MRNLSLKLFINIFILMQKLAEIQLDKTVTLKVQCNLNDQVVVKNFRILMDCIKDLSSNHNDLASKFTKLSDRVSNIQRNDGSNDLKTLSGQQLNGLAESDKQNILKLIKELDGRTSSNQKNILDNIKDINLINKQLQDLKQLLQKLGSGGGDKNSATDTTKDTSTKNALEMLKLSKQNQENKQLINKTNEQLDRLKKQVNSLKEKLDKLLEKGESKKKQSERSEKNIKQSDNNSEGFNKAEFNEIKEKVAILNKKTGALELLTDNLKVQNNALSDAQTNMKKNQQNFNKQLEQLKEKFLTLLKGNGNKGNSNSSNSKLEEDLKQLKNQLKQLRSQLEQLRRQNQNNSKTSIQEQKKNRLDKGSFTQNKFNQDGLRDLTMRVQYLQKLMGSKNSLTEERQKLPVIKRPRAKQRDTSIQQKSTSKKDISDLKSDIQAWLNNYLNEQKNRQNFDDMQLKIQQIKNILNRKADHEGMKKGLTFLEAKINQLYLFLTEPDGEDAMIVRKGFNCLSCSKKVENLRGKLGPHINWNNMTSTNYSPPKVGYSRHMGENSGDKSDDQ